MGWLKRWRARVGRIFGSSTFEREMDEEMRFHLAEETADRIRSGMTPAEARRTALRDFGRVAEQKEAARRVRGFPWLDDLAGDLRFALRGLRRSPGISAAAVATLALGVGAATATFAVVDGILLRSLPYPDPNQLVAIWETRPDRQRWVNSVAVTNFEAMASRSRTLSAVAALVPDQQVVEHGKPDRIAGAAVSSGWFDVVGVGPMLGRGFSAEESVAQSSVIVLSHSFWRDDFGADSTLVGRPIQLQARRFTVVGVMPPGFVPPAFGWISPDQRYWIPFAPSPANRPWGRSLMVLGRLRSGRSVAEARADLAAIMAVRETEEPEQNRGWSATATDLRQQIVGEVRAPLLVLLAAVGALLLATVANVISITLAKLRRRAPEVSLRLALGAGRGRLGRQAIAEAIALALVAAPFGAAIAAVGIAGLQAAGPAGVPRVEGVRFDLGLALLALGLTAAATLVSTLAPALRFHRPALGGAAGAGNRVTTRAQGGRLIVAEIAIALVLTIAAGLAMRSFVSLRSTDLGFTAERVTAYRISLPERYDTTATRTFYRALLSRLEAAPGIERVGRVSVRPLGGTRVATSVFPVDRVVEKKDAPSADIRVASAGYFSTLGIPVLAGRYPEPGGFGEAPVLITRGLAETLWPGRPAVGQGLRVNLNGGIAARVAGVVEDARLNGPRTDPRPTLYFPLEASRETELDLLARARGPEDRIGAVVTDAVWTLDRSLPVYQIESLAGLLRDSMSTDRVSFWLLAGFSLVAILLAAAGVAGVLLVEVARRRRELGVRLALGATAGGVRAGVVRAGVRLALLGIGIGLAGAVLLTRFMGHQLHGVRPIDPLTYAVVAGILFLVAVGAAYLPARRATTVDPIEVLRSE
jgi:predicted permease